MSRRKLKKFADNEMRANVIQPGKPLFEQVKGRWNELVFHNDNDIVLELACGRGEYTVGLAAAYPDKNFIGVDVKGDRIWRGSTNAVEQGLENAAFLRTHIAQLPDFFAANEVADIWIVHPDPRPKDSDERRRLTFPRYLDIYKSLLKPGGWVRLKTDNPGLFDYTLDTLAEQPVKDLVHTRDLYTSELAAEHHGIVTRYEREFTAKGFSVKYLKFRFKEETAEKSE